MRSGRHRDANGQPRIDGVCRVCRLFERRFQIRVSPDADEADPLAVERHLHLVRVLETTEIPEVRAEEPGPHVVFPVNRECVANQHPSHRSQRQTLDVLVLREILADAEGLGDRARVEIADRETADALGR